MSPQSPDRRATTGAVVDFDLFAASTRQESDDNWRTVREQCPVAWTEQNGGHWVAAGYDAVCDAFRNWELFSSARTDPGLSSISYSPNRGTPLLVPEEMDPPEWQPLRRVLGALLSPDAARQLRPRAEYWTSHYLDQVIESGRCDLVHDLAAAVPAAVTLEWLGFPESDWAGIAGVFHAIAAYRPGTPERDNAVAGFGTVMQRITEEIELRRRNERDDALSRLISSEVDGQRLPADTVRSMVFLVIGGGVDTTTSLTSAALMHLDRSPSDRARLIAEPELLTTATEEFLRFYPPARTHARTAARDATFAGEDIHAGDRIVLSELSANYDGAAFTEPDKFILDRFPNRHVSFGMGIHRCPGSHLARVEFDEMIRAVLTRLPDYRLDHDALTEYPTWSMIGGWSRMPAEFSPGRRTKGGNDRASSR
jgi:cytochrome P450